MNITDITLDVDTLDGRVDDIEAEMALNSHVTDGMTREPNGAGYTWTLTEKKVILASENIEFGVSGDTLEGLQAQADAHEETIAAVSRYESAGGDSTTKITDTVIRLQSNEVFYGSTIPRTLASLDNEVAINTWDISQIEGEIEGMQSDISGIQTEMATNSHVTDGMTREPNGADYTWTLTEKKIVLASENIEFGVSGDTLEGLQTLAETNETDISAAESRLVSLESKFGTTTGELDKDLNMGGYSITNTDHVYVVDGSDVGNLHMNGPHLRLQGLDTGGGIRLKIDDQSLKIDRDETPYPVGVNLTGVGSLVSSALETNTLKMGDDRLMTYHLRSAVAKVNDGTKYYYHSQRGFEDFAGTPIIRHEAGRISVYVNNLFTQCSHDLCCATAQGHRTGGSSSSDLLVCGILSVTEHAPYAWESYTKIEIGFTNHEHDSFRDLNTDGTLYITAHW